MMSAPGRAVLLTAGLVAGAAAARALGLPGLTAALVAVLVMLAGAGATWAFRARRRRTDDGGFGYVYVEEDGGARELAPEERAHLLEEHHPADGGRPYVKPWYSARTPDSRLAGYLRRDRLPRSVSIRPSEADLSN